MASKKLPIKLHTLASVEVKERTVDNFLNNEVRSYAKYVIETRALPNIMDGLRVGARKIVYAALDSPNLKKGSKIKMNKLVGDALSLQYHHGDTSLVNTIIQLATPHTLNTPALDVIGQIGSLRVPEHDTAARYLHVKAGEFLDMYRTDLELTTEQWDDGEKIEPKFLLPVLPLVLMQRTSNPGFGFSFRGFSFNPDDIIAATMQAVVAGSCDGVDRFDIKPYVEGINPNNILWNENKQSWYNVGEYVLDYDTDTLTIIDLPYNVSFEKYCEKLSSLVESGYIVSYADYSRDNKTKFVIKFNRGRLKMMYEFNKWKFFTNFWLFKKIEKLTLNCISENGDKILFFETPNQLVDEFVRLRMGFYEMRKKKTIQLLEERNILLDERIRFIRLVVDGKLIISKRSIKDIQVDLDGYKIRYDVLKLPISRLTIDEINKSMQEIQDNQDELAYIRKTSEKEMYINDIIDIKEKYYTISKIDVI